MSFICYLTLVAFISVIGIAISSGEYFSSKKTEVASNKGISNNINFVFEEETGSNDLVPYSLLSHQYFGGNYFTNFTSVLLLLALPALVLFVSIGLDSPKPTEVNLEEAIPFSIR